MENEDAKNFDWNHCVVFNKLDGSLIKIYNFNNEWYISTNGTAFAEGESSMGKSFHDLFIEAIGIDLQEAFEKYPKEYTYIFELTSPENRIVTIYKRTKATLLAIRNNITGDYIDYDNIIDFPFANLAESYTLNNIDDIISFVENRNEMDEGVVCYCPDTGVRIKIKNSSYVAIHHLKNNGENSVKGFINLTFKQEYVEFLSYFPEFTENMMKYVNAHQKFLNYIDILWEKYKHIENQKEFALMVINTPISGILFSLKKGIELDDIIGKLTMNSKIKHLNNFL